MIDKRKAKDRFPLVQSTNFDLLQMRVVGFFFFSCIPSLPFSVGLYQRVFIRRVEENSIRKVAVIGMSVVAYPFALLTLVVYKNYASLLKKPLITTFVTDIYIYVHVYVIGLFQLSVHLPTLLGTICMKCNDKECKYV